MKKVFVLICLIILPHLFLLPKLAFACDPQEIDTAIGCIDPNNLQDFIQQLLGLALGVAGGIAFLLMLFGSFQIMTSSGNPEKMKAGSELITSALTGLLFIVFSVFILKLIGVTILDIPGFGQ